ncbi:MAG TPA: DHA2 family efflux MFS transporter permease subunit [Stellaceae bacterium]|nr:DHA2 family efflux MFS transporter permease subunit [Stellaceae bacterium]
MVGEVEAGVDPTPAALQLPAGWARTLASCGLILAAALQAADYAIVTVALPQLEHDLGTGLNLGAWVIVSYLCATAVTAPLTGWLRRRYGAQRLFIGAVGGFIAASLLCAFSPSAAAIILFRLLQGAAGGLIHPLAQAMLLDIYPTERHGKIIGVFSAGLMGGLVLGPPLGGFITDLASWRWVFLINLPLGCVAIACIWRLRSLTETNRDRTIDPLGILLLITGIGALQLFLARGIDHSWFQSPEISLEAIITFSSFTLLTARARGRGITVFRPDILKDVNFVVACVYQFMLSALLFATIVFLPLLAEGPLGLPAMVGGSLITPRAIVLMLVMLFVGRLIGRIDQRVLLVGGWLLMAGGLFVLAAVPPRHPAGWIIIGSSIQSVGAGILYIPLVTLAYSTLTADRRTDAAGLYILLRQLGYASGVALMTSVLRAATAANLSRLVAAGGTKSPQLANAAASAAYAECFEIMAIASLILVPGAFLFRLRGLGDNTGAPVAPSGGG